MSLMFSDYQLEDIWCKARDVSSLFPVTYENLFGYERLAVLHVLKEPVQSTLHAIMQKNVPPRTKCVYQHTAIKTCRFSCFMGLIGKHIYQLIRGSWHV